ncbi:IS110 family transposase [Larkinella bovis]|uniref:IS110 family transposase n=1 Tax=Larkinella bovis TaxID=683041 RepID=A0ABW0IJ89_9BACT
MNRWPTICIRLNKPSELSCPTRSNISLKVSTSTGLPAQSKTDAIDARLIAQLGLERTLEAWQPAPAIFRELRSLTRFYTALKQQRTAISNWKESLDSGHQPLEFLRKSNQALLQTLDRQIQQCQQQIQQLIAREAWLAAKVKKLLTIKGIGLVTVAIILAETQGFGTITNAKQLASYAGYDVVERQSGSSIKGQTRISKKGNSHIRAALHFPALVASRHNPVLQQVYQRINQNKPSKMVGATALQRKLLLLMYALWKNDTEYQKRESKPAAQQPHRLADDQKAIGRR